MSECLQYSFYDHEMKLEINTASACGMSLRKMPRVTNMVASSLYGMHEHHDGILDEQRRPGALFSLPLSWNLMVLVLASSPFPLKDITKNASYWEVWG